jgi:hypothetical protein
MKTGVKGFYWGEPEIATALCIADAGGTLPPRFAILFLLRSQRLEMAALFVGELSGDPDPRRHDRIPAPS